jgi:hypothetical protein
MWQNNCTGLLFEGLFFLQAIYMKAPIEVEVLSPAMFVVYNTLRARYFLIDNGTCLLSIAVCLSRMRGEEDSPHTY